MESKLYFLDTETGGLSSYYNGLCSLFIKKYNSEFQENLLFYPQKKIYDVGALNVNGFKLNDLFVKGSSRMKIIDLFNNLAEVHQKDKHFIICGWNISFDMQFIGQVYKDYRLNLPCPIISFDLKEIATKNIKKKDGRKKVDDGVENYKLTTIYQHFFDDFNEDLAHTADYDVLMCERLYDKFKELDFL